MNDTVSGQQNIGDPPPQCLLFTLECPNDHPIKALRAFSQLTFSNCVLVLQKHKQPSYKTRIYLRFLTTMCKVKLRLDLEKYALHYFK